jgi:dolichol kinase
MPDLNYLELAFGSLFYQFSLYIAMRLAHRVFTLGELGLVSFGGTALYMEFLNLTIATVRSPPLLYRSY